MTIHIESEKESYCGKVKVTKNTYYSDYGIDARIRVVFGTFKRTLTNRGNIPIRKKDSEIENLVHVLKEEVIHPILDLYHNIAETQVTFDGWHKTMVDNIRAKCPITWGQGSVLTVGMSQKLINLPCKDMWALDLIPKQYSVFFHAVIDQTTLKMLKRKGRQPAWTRLDSYEKYRQLQLELRKLSQDRKTYPLAIECENWNKSH